MHSINPRQLCSLHNCLPVFCWHLPPVHCDWTACIVVVCCHFFQDVHERRDFEFCWLRWCLDSQEGERLVHVGVGVYHEVLWFIDEALPENLQSNESWRCLVKHFDVLSGGNLPLFHDSLIFLVEPCFMVVDVRVILTNLPNKRFSVALCWCEERLLSLEDFLLDVPGSVDVEHAR